jgi:hypothetical protein
VCAIDEGLGQIDLASRTQIVRESLEHFPEHTLGYPLLHPAVNRLIWRVLARECDPRCTGPKDPEHSVENIAWRDTWAALAVLASLRFGDQRLDNTPLLVGELHGLLDHAVDR